MESYRTAVSRWRHPVNIALHANAPVGVRVANSVTGFMGSWRFIILQTAVVVLWVAGNVYLLFHFDPYPFIFLNLAFSTQAAYAAPLILLAGNQSAVRDRATLEHAALEAEEADEKDDDLRARLVRIEALLATLSEGKGSAREVGVDQQAAATTARRVGAEAAPPVVEGDRSVRME